MEAGAAVVLVILAFVALNAILAALTDTRGPRGRGR